MHDDISMIDSVYQYGITQSLRTPTAYVNLFFGLRHFGSTVGTVYVKAYIFLLYRYDTLDYFVEDSG